MDKLLSVSVVLFTFTYPFQDASGQKNVPTWWKDQPFTVEWTMTDSYNNFTLNVKQYYSARYNRLRWDLYDQESYVVWALGEQWLSYVFPARIDGRDMTLMSTVKNPFLMDTTQRQRALTIMYPDMGNYDLDHRNSNPPFFKWVQMGQNPYNWFKSTVWIIQKPGLEPLIHKVRYEKNDRVIITNYRNHQYGEPDDSIWTFPQNLQQWKNEQGTKDISLTEEMLVNSYLRGADSIWPNEMRLKNQRFAQLAIAGNDLTRARTGLPQYITPFPYSLREYDTYEYPRDLDWTRCNAVTDVKDQDICSGCGAFAAVGALESAHFINQGELINISVQAVIDCSWGDSRMRQRINSGCFSGFPDSAFEWVAENNGIPTTEQYGQFKRMNGGCRLHGDDWFNLVAPISSYTKVPKSVNALKMALLRHGPVTVGLTIDELMTYTSGIIRTQPKEGAIIRHTGLVVGYGVTSRGEGYWKVRNSWGPRWGMDGYLYVLMSDYLNPMLLLDDNYYVNMENNGSSRTYCDICDICYSR